MGGDRRSVGRVPQTGFLNSNDSAERPTLKWQFQKSFFKFIQVQKLLITRLTVKDQLVAVSSHNYVGIMPLIPSTYLGDLFVIGCGERVDNSGITLRCCLKHYHHAAVIESDNEILEEIIPEKPVKRRFIQPGTGSAKRDGRRVYGYASNRQSLELSFPVYRCAERTF
jgi:hypothetical protein